MISLAALTPGHRPVPTSGPGPQPGAIAITAFSRDRIVFDSGTGFGRATADIPLSGTATAGMAVEARALSLDDGGATTTPWTEIGAGDAGGLWSGTITVPRGASWYHPQVRLKAQPGIMATGAMRFGVGHVIALWGQSEVDRILSAFYDNTTPPAVADPEAVQVIYGAVSAPQASHVSDAQPVTAAVAAMAATLIATRPGEKFAIVFHGVAGTDPRALVDDADLSRLWSDDKALHDFATADGQHVGLAAMSWFASPGSLGSSYGEVLFPLFSGKTTGGSPVSFPATIPWGVGNSFQADHWFGELYDYTRTKWVPYGPHRFEIDGDMADATHYAGGGLQFNLTNKEAARNSWRSMLALPDATMFLPLGLELTTYANGFDDGAGGWTDIEHPAGDTADGVQAWARLTALAILQSAGLTPWSAPVFDQCLWDPSGAWVEIWSSAGPVTTTRLLRGEPALPPTYPHWTEVAGVQINGQPAATTQIVAGRLRVFPNSGSFTSTDVINFGEGGATGALKFPEDLIAGFWKNLPIVDVGAAGLDGVPVRPLPDPAVLANTLPPSAPRFTTSSGGPYFIDPANLGGGVTAMTFSTRFIVDALPSTTFILFTQANVGFDVELMNSGHLRINVKDGAGTKVLGPTVVAAGLGAGIWYDLVVAADQVAQVAHIRVNGTLIAALPFTTAGNGVFQSSRAIGFLARGSGALQTVGQVEWLKVWKSVSGAGLEPVTTPFKAIAGSLAAVNADPWKLGANAS
ncbi:MAG: hypothetical protein KDE08_12995 [Rhodobacteraceae bacterium]|nr:hypothetical protein [Paracoccaceae bacterium]